MINCLPNNNAEIPNKIIKPIPTITEKTSIKRKRKHQSIDFFSTFSYKK